MKQSDADGESYLLLRLSERSLRRADIMVAKMHSSSSRGGLRGGRKIDRVEIR